MPAVKFCKQLAGFTLAQQAHGRRLLTLLAPQFDPWAPSAPAGHMPIRSGLILAFMAFAWAWPTAGQAQHAHVHGLARLGVAADGPNLQVDLDAPLESLVGFEHAPRNARQREALVVMKARLQQAGALWRPNAQAVCERTDGDVHVHEGDHGHADVTASVSYRCRHPEALKYIDIDMWQAFGPLKTLSVSVALPRRQFTRKYQRHRTSAAARQAAPVRLWLVPTQSR